MWEDRSLRDIKEADIRQLVESGLPEYLHLEYKSELYRDTDPQAREFLRDVCMFANAAGGILLIGVPEKRDAHGQPTGLPDPDLPLGIELPNPEKVLEAYDSRAVASIGGRLPLESAAINVAGGLYVLVIRVPNSLIKPHRVYHQGHVNFPSRRERQRYEMDVHEIKEMVMRTASRLEDAERKLRESFLEMRGNDDSPLLLIACIPVFGQDFMLDVQNAKVIDATTKLGFHGMLRYNFTGLEQPVSDKAFVQVRRNGLMVLNQKLGDLDSASGVYRFYPAAIDVHLRDFVIGAAGICQAAELAGPYLLGMALRLRTALVAMHERSSFPLSIRDYHFPMMQADNLADVHRTIRPLCDQAHQMVGRKCSPCFGVRGEWISPTRF